MDAEQIYTLLQDACRALEGAEEYAIAALVSRCMALVNERFGVGDDHLDIED